MKIPILGDLLAGVSKKVSGSLLNFSIGPMLPWIILAVVTAIGLLAINNAMLRVDLAECRQAASDHAAEDERLVREAVEQQRAKEDIDRAARTLIDQQFQEIRNGLENENAVLRADLAAGRQRVRQSLCAPAVSRQLPTTSAAAAPPQDKPRDLASAVGRISGAAARKDADYAELLAIATSDRRTCGVTP